MKLYDISREISPHMTFYSPDDKMEVIEVMQLKNGDMCNLTRYDISAHTGTHIDTPLHFIEDGAACDGIDLRHFYGKAKLIQSIKTNVSKEDLIHADIQAGDIILLNTNGKVLTTDAALYLVEKQIKTIGIDSLSVDEYGSNDFPVHHILLGSGIAIIEGLKLDDIPQGIYDISALPLKFKDGNGSPVRAVLADHRKLEAVLFDMDGLMIDTEPISKAFWKQAIECQGFTMDEDFFAPLIGRTKSGVRDLLNNHYGPTFDFEKACAMRDKSMEDYVSKHGVSMKKGLIQILDCLDALGLKKAVATSTEMDSMKRKLKRIGVFDRFDAYVSGDQVQFGKPNPEIFLTAASRLGVLPQNCIVFEDSNAGISAAYDAGMRPILVPDMAITDKASYARIFAKCESLIEAVELVNICHAS